MIWLTRLDGTPILVNDDLVVSVEVASDTILSFQNGDRLRVLESSEELLRRVVTWRQRIGLGALLAPEAMEPGLPGAGTDPEREA